MGPAEGQAPVVFAKSLDSPGEFLGIGAQFRDFLLQAAGGQAIAVPTGAPMVAQLVGGDREDPGPQLALGVVLIKTPL